MSKWEWKKLKDICEKGSSNIKQSDLKDLTGDYPIFGASGYIQNVDFYQRDRDYIGIIKDGSGVGRTMLLPAFSSVIGTLQYILPKEGNDIKFINYALQNIDFSKSVQGAAIPHIYFKDYGETEILVPPLSEQKRIVKFLDEEFSKIETLKTNTETNLKNAKELFETTLEKELNPLSRHSERSEESSADLPSGWEWIKISTLVTKCLNIKWDKIALNDSRLYIDLSSVNKDTQCIENVSEINVENAPSRAKQIIHEKDVLFATTRPTQKRVCIVEREFDNQICSTGFCVLRPQACLESKYLFYCLLSDDYYSYIKPLEKGANYPAVTDGDVKNYEISLPPLSVQKEIVARLDKLSENVKRLEANYKQIIADCDELKKSILKKTFEGDSRSSRE